MKCGWCKSMRNAVGMLFLLALLCLVPALPAAAAGLIIDGIPRTFLPEPYLAGTTAMIPLRPVMESLGAAVSWNSADNSISCHYSGHEVRYHLDSRTMSCDGKVREMPEAATMQGGVVFVPARLALESLGFPVSWQSGSLIVGSLSPESSSPISAPGFYISSTSAAQGQMLLLWMKPCQAGDIVTFNSSLPGVRSAIYDYGDSKVKLIGIEKNAPPAQYSYHVVLERGGVRLVDISSTVQVRPGNFAEQHLWVDSSLADILDSDLAARDDILIAEALSSSCSQPLWQEAFMQPCDGKITTAYGTYRYVNGDSPYQHSGIDIAADYDVPVQAANNGVVAMAASLYVTGNTIIIDHGCGVYSMYCHLGEMYAAPGDAVDRGGIIGTVGSTGFSTGPHLHWNMGIDESPLNPFEFVGNNPLWMRNL